MRGYILHVIDFTAHGAVGVDTAADSRLPGLHLQIVFVTTTHFCKAIGVVGQ